MENQKKEPILKDAVCIPEWRTMLSVFETIIEGRPAPEKVKQKLEDLSEAAAITSLLSTRQKDGIVARCRNYINGNYGNDAIKANYIQNNAQK